METSEQTQKPSKMPEPAQSRLLHFFLAALMVLGLFGGSCAMQDVMPEAANLPTHAAYKRHLSSLKLTQSAGITEAEVDAIADASINFIQSQRTVRRRFHRPLAVASFLMVLAYMALFIVAHRVWRSGKRWASLLSKVALTALPIRAALAGLEYAVLANLRGPLRTLATRLALNGAASMPPGTDENALNSAAVLYGNLAVSAGNIFFWCRTLAVAAMLYAAYALFARPEVQELFQGSAHSADDDDTSDGGDESR